MIFFVASRRVALDNVTDVLVLRQAAQQTSIVKTIGQPSAYFIERNRSKAEGCASSNGPMMDWSESSSFSSG
jgi:hypothetical protein